MAFADTLKIVPRDLSGVFYTGKPLRKSDVISIDPAIKKIVFRQPVDIKALNFASTTEVVLVAPSKIVHVMAAGRLIALAGLFSGSIEAGGDVIVKGDLAIWLGDVDTQNGDICVSGDLTCSGRVRAPAGYVIVNGQAEAAAFPVCRGLWEGASGSPIPPEVREAAARAGGHIRKHIGR